MPLSFASSSGMSSSRSSSSSTSSNVINGDKLYPSLESICYRSSEEDEDFDTIALDESHSSSSSSKRYLYPQKEFVEELRPEEVRWFHKLETDTGKNWTAFIGYDSLRIECRYRALNLSNENGDIDENEKILVRGGLYEVDIKEKKCVPVYWSEEDSVILRGIWFEEGSWQPLEESFANDIESAHMAKFQGLRLEEAPESQKGPKPVVHNIRFKDFHVDWNASNEVHKYSENTSSKLLRNVRQSMGLQKSGNRLFRGYCYEAVMDDKPPDINHLVFVIHGIGQKMDTGSIVRCTKDLRDRVKYMRGKMFPDFDLTNKRAEFLPVQWRSSLKLDGDTVETVTPHKMKGVRNVLNSSAMDVLYYTSPLYRFEITNSLKAELCRLYQMFCSRHPYFEPSDGKVSIVAHSLGSVISYDIITGWNPLHLYDQLITSLIDEEEEKACGNSEVLEDVQAAKNKVKDLDALMKSIQGKQGKIVKSIPFNVKLSTPVSVTSAHEGIVLSALYPAAFTFFNMSKVENLFCIGSPLAVFLALRGVRPEGNGSQNHILSTSLCKRLFNIFHPSDPVAYRLEPLILKHYSTIMPLPIHHFSAPKKLPYSMFPARAYAALTGTVDELGKEKPTKEEDIGETGVKEAAQKFSLASWFSNRKKKDVAEKLTAELQLMNKRGSEAAAPLPDADNLDKTELEYRLDFQLREQRMENSYLSVLTSHTSYWLNKDISYFLLTHLHPELQEGETP